MVVSLDFHDFSVENNNLFYIDKLREQYPDFKVSMFYIPADYQYYSHLNDFQKDQAKELIRKAVHEGWLELIPHGITHAFGEFHEATYKDMELAMDAYEEHFTKDLKLPYVKGFCAPNWLISKEAVEALDDHGWWLAVDKNQPDSLKTKKYYEYNWDVAYSFPKEQKVVKGHGHISEPSANNLPHCLKNLCKIPEAKWKFVSELV